MQFSRADRLGALLLAIIILILVVLLSLGDNFKKKQDAVLSAKEKQEMERFVKGVKAAAERKERERREKYNYGTTYPKETFRFNPNTADYDTFLRLGLRPWQAKNALKYRAKGGVWRKADDFAKLYGLSKEDFERLRPYIDIPEEHRTTVLRTEREVFDFPEKLKEGTTLPLNAADTTQLKQIPGIGSYYANKIVRYRERLGGFVSLVQLGEVEGLPADVQRWFRLDAVDVQKLSVNKATFKELVRHPYLNYEQVKVIANYVRQYGKLHSWQDLRYSKLFTEEDIRRLENYFVFE